VLFKRLKEEIIRLKDEGRVLMRFNELRETLQLRLSGEFKRFADEELRAVLTLLAGPGVVWELAFGSWVLLQPERINAYAQAVIRTLQADEHQRGCLMEERVLKGDLAYPSPMLRLASDEERFVLLAMHQTLVERGFPSPSGRKTIASDLLSRGNEVGRFPPDHALPHPGPLPLGEGARPALAGRSGASGSRSRWTRGSLSRRERAGVRGNSPPSHREPERSRQAAWDSVRFHALAPPPHTPQKV
jgi:hypothetical protein